MNIDELCRKAAADIWRLDGRFATEDDVLHAIRCNIAPAFEEMQAECDKYKKRSESCCFCGGHFPESLHKLQEHSEHCGKHPISALRAENECLKDAIQDAMCDPLLKASERTIQKLQDVRGEPVADKWGVFDKHQVAALEAENERLKQERNDETVDADSYFDVSERQRLIISDLEQQVAELRRDAERYRCLRNETSYLVVVPVSHCGYWSGERLDAAIDAAMETTDAE